MLVSLFCGPGGLDEGFKRAGFTTIYATDIDQSAVDSHNLNHGGVAVWGDITKLKTDDLIAELQQRITDANRDGEHPVGIIGGPPCQSFSYGNTNQFEEDPRHSLPSHYARVIKGLRDHGWLDFFLFENVPGLKELHSEKFEKFKQEFRDAGFTLFEKGLEAWQFGVPQLRPRVFIVGFRKDHPAADRFKWPEPIIKEKSQARTVEWAIGHLREQPPAFFTRELTPEKVEEEHGHRNHWCMNPMSKKFKDGTFARSGKFGKSFAVLDWRQPSLTVAYGHREVHIHPDGNRRLSVYEAMRLQGFPHSYKLAGTLSDQIHLVSEVVAPPVAYHIAKAIGRALELELEDDRVGTWLPAVEPAPDAD